MSSSAVRLRLADIVENAGFVADYVAGLSEADFLQDRKTRDAVERCLARITEAVIQIGEQETERLRLGVTWSEVRGLGNRLRHEYRRIDGRVILATARGDLPLLREAARRALEA